MKEIESAGKTREEAIQNGLKELGVDMHEIEKIDVIDEGSKGFLGIGARPVRVRLTLDKPDEDARRDGGRRERQPRREGGRADRPEQRGGDRQERQEQRGGGRQERQGSGRQERQGGDRQERQQGRGGEKQDQDKSGDNRQRDGGRQQDNREEGRRKKKRSRGQDGAPNPRGDNNAPQKGNQQQGNAHKASPITGRKNLSVTDEAADALRRVEHFDNGDDAAMPPNDLPPNARPEEEIETITDEQGKEAAAMLNEILGLMELGGQANFARVSDGSARLAIDSEDDGGILIGKRGVTLNAIQYLVNRMIAKNDATDNTERVVVDVGGYVERRHGTLADMAKTMAKRAKDSGRNVRLKPLSPQERRIVHLTLEPDPQVRTYSLGDSLFRSIVINPVGGRGGGQQGRGRRSREGNDDGAEQTTA